jgi:cytochrome b561
MSKQPVSHYDAIAMALHWLIGLALLGQIAFGFLLDDLAPRGTVARASVINLHKSCGIVLGLTILARLMWRLWHSPPAWPVSLPRWQQRAARAGHWALYACMVVMPLSGYVASNFSKYGIRFFGHSWPAWGPTAPSVYAFFNSVHVVTAWLFCILIAGHVAAALKHAWVDRDGVFARMLPRSSSRASRRSLS